MKQKRRYPGWQQYRWNPKSTVCLLEHSTYTLIAETYKIHGFVCGCVRFRIPPHSMTIETLCERLVFRSIDKALNRGEVLAQRLGERSWISLSLIRSSPVTLKKEGKKEELWTITKGRTVEKKAAITDRAECKHNNKTLAYTRRSLHGVCHAAHGPREAWRRCAHQGWAWSNPEAPWPHYHPPLPLHRPVSSPLLSFPSLPYSFLLLHCPSLLFHFPCNPRNS